LVVWTVSTYNFFVSSKARIKAAVQEIGNQLKRQADLIPNLEESAKGYLKHEKGVYKDLTDARKSINAAVKSGDLQKMADAGSKLAAVLPDIQGVVVSNPRRLVIDLTADFNVRRVSFPSNIVASLFNFGELPGITTPGEGEHVEVSGEELKTPKVKL
jgi:LemA protein